MTLASPSARLENVRVGDRGPRPYALLLAVGLLSTAVSPQPAGAQTVIDPFVFAQPFQFVTCGLPCPGPGCPPPVTNFAADPSILGGERDITLMMTACVFAGTTSSTLVSGGTFVANNGTGVEATIIIQWDGPDNSPTLAHTGLGGIDLMAVGQDTLRLRVTDDDLMVPVTIDVYTDAANASRCTTTLPGGIVMTATDFGFDFPGTMVDDCTFTVLLGAGATFATVGAIEARIGGPGFPSVDLTLDFLRTDMSPTPVELMSFSIE